ncbi:MAG: hypothetical protein ABIQ16_10620 [Polyangiaceae bacterium]
MNSVGLVARGAAGASPPDLVCGAASMRTGALLDEILPHDVRERLEGLAATLPELFATIDSSCLERLAQRLGGDGDAQSFSEILMLSDKHLHLIQPLRRRPGVALLAVCSATSSIGLALSAIRARALVLEGE